MKFKPGDYFKVRTSGLTGQVIRIQTDKIAGHHLTNNYVVLWDHMSRSAAYDADEVDSTDLWELISVTHNPSLSFGNINHVPIHITVDNAKFDKVNCNHEWTEYVGFKDSFTYCKKCDQKRN